MSLLIAELVCEATRKNDSGAVVRHTGADRVVIGLGSSEPFRYIGQFKPRYFGMLGWLNAWMGKMGQVAWEHHRESLEVAGDVVFTGHGDGGGIAQVMAAYYHLTYPERRTRVVCFGSPRVAFPGARFRRIIQDTMSPVLYAREGDPLPRLPLPPLYRHAVAVTRIATDDGDDFTPESHDMERIQNHELHASLMQGKPGRHGPDEIYGVKNATG